MRMRNRGFSLLEVVIVLAIAAILFTIATPSLLKSFQIGNENNVAGELAQIGVAEKTFSSSYQGYVAIAGLTGTLPTTGNPVSCSNSFLLNGAQISDPPGYHLTPAYTGSVTLTGTNCPPGISSFTINADPINNLSGQRHFFVDQTGVVRFDEHATASAASNPYSTAVSTNGGSTNNGGNGNQNNAVGTNVIPTWDPNATYPIGSQVLRPTIVAGLTCSPSQAGYAVGVFVFVSATNSNTDPCLPNSADWFTSTGVTSVAAASVCNQPLTGSIPDVTLSPGGSYTWQTGLNTCGTYTHWIITTANQNAAQTIVGIQFTDGSGSGSHISCNLPAGATTCTGPAQGDMTSGGVNISKNDNLYIGFSTPSNSFEAPLGKVTWQLTP